MKTLENIFVIGGGIIIVAILIMFAVIIQEHKDVIKQQRHTIQVWQEYAEQLEHKLHECEK